MQNLLPQKNQMEAANPVNTTDSSNGTITTTVTSKSDKMMMNSENSQSSSSSLIPQKTEHNQQQDDGDSDKVLAKELSNNNGHTLTNGLSNSSSSGGGVPTDDHVDGDQPEKIGTTKTGDVDGFLARINNLQGLEDPPPPADIVWRNVFIFGYLHLVVLYGVYLVVTGHIKWQTIVLAWVLHFWGGMGITAGAHRCWSHKAYKAKTPLKIILAFMQTLAFQNSIWEWVRDHRVHHKYAETNADPHNAKRGFFFAHIGWLLCRKHELVRVKGKTMDMSDIESDPIIMFQKKYHLPLGLLVCFVLPAVIPWKLWDESLLGAFLICSLARYTFTLHITWLVNSAAHMWGPKPYDKTINPAENRSVAFWAFGEGWHNYHHVFPWDYKTAELGQYQWNLTTAFVDFFAAIGWAYDLKTVPKKVVMQRVKRTGDGTWADHHDHDHHDQEHAVWGWGDKDIPKSSLAVTQTLYPTGKED